MKQAEPWLIGHSLFAFPPVNSGGLIEAACAPLDERAAGAFPPVNSGGLIEAAMRARSPSATSRVSAGEFRRPH